MRWIESYELFLFDLDGLLVNTEEIHYRAYVQMCKGRGYTIPWSFSQYFQIAQQDAGAPERAVYAEFPALQKQEPNWKVLYAEKKRAFLEILENEPAPLLPGAEKFLKILENAQKKRCVVTHSQTELVALLRKQNPILNTIPHWFTREDYSLPKPAPDGYLKAIETLNSSGGKVIGFEDSDRGMRSLMATIATPVLINSIDEKTRASFASMGVKTYTSFDELLLIDDLYEEEAACRR
jgi:beta-phosphoglucomutase